MSDPTPLLDAFRRGEVDRDVRLLAAEGALAPRAMEQLALLILLLDDADVEVRTVASATIERIPVERLKRFLGRSDVPTGIREFFAARDVLPDESPTVVADDPLIETGPEIDEGTAASEEPGSDNTPRVSTTAALAQMTFPQRLKAAVKGSKEVRAVLIRDPNKLIASTVLSSPKVNSAEVAGFAKMANVSEDVLRIIGANRAWMKNYNVVVGLTKNPKTPLGMTLNLLNRLNDKDLQLISIDRNVPEVLRQAARKRIVASTSKH
jgi:hypothetical protein